MTLGIKSIRIVSRRPGSEGPEPLPGDVIEVETAGGVVMEVDPATRKTTNRIQRFEVIDREFKLVPVRRRALLSVDANRLRYAWFQRRSYY